MRQGHENRRGAGVFSGLLFLAIGLILLAGNFNLLPVQTTLSQWWPVLLIIMGVKHFIVFRGTQAWAGGLFWLGTGILFLSVTLGYLDIAISRILWPVMLIWFGLFTVLGSSACGRTLNGGSQS